MSTEQIKEQQITEQQYKKVDQPEQQERCQSHLWQLLYGAKKECFATDYYRILNQSKICNFKPLDKLYEQYEKHIEKYSPGGIQRILEYEDNDKDFKVIHGAFSEYQQHDEKMILKCVNWTNYLKYEFYFSQERIFYLLGITGSVYGSTMYIVNSNYGKWLKDKYFRNLKSDERKNNKKE